MDIPIFFSVPSEAANDHSQKKEKKEAANDRSIEQKQIWQAFSGGADWYSSEETRNKDAYEWQILNFMGSLVVHHFSSLIFMWVISISGFLVPTVSVLHSDLNASINCDFIHKLRIEIPLGEISFLNTILFQLLRILSFCLSRNQTWYEHDYPMCQ